MGAGDILIGTSGWHYDHWRGPFYPGDLPKKDMLPHYAAQFRTAEINNSFYNLPSAQTLEAWKESVPPGFRFAAKASRYITHMKKLKNGRDTVPGFLEQMRVLGDALGPILFQLPPRWKVNSERLSAFLSGLPRGHRYAFEFRDTSWFDDAVYHALEAHGAAFCIYHLAGSLSPKEVTSDFVYVRLHGPENAYEGRYDTETLSGWAGALTAWAEQGRDVYCYFDNDEAGYAPLNAAELQKMIID